MAQEAAVLGSVERPRPSREVEPGFRFDVTRFEPVKKLLQHRAFQFLIILPNLFVFALVILTGIFGTPVGNRNFSIIFVWIVWWALLIMLLIPVGARIWCAMCPIPAPGEWLQRLAIVRGPRQRMLTLGKKWPKPLRNIWLQNFSFVGVAVFSGLILTRPAVTGWLLLSFVLIATALMLVFERRVFCRYVCPVGGFIGLYSMAAPMEVRTKDPSLCTTHKTKECMLGCDAGYACPWMESLPTMTRNAYCGMCTECLKTCTQNNVAWNIRAFGKDLFVPRWHLDEAFKAHIMLAAAAVYSAVMLGPWGRVKDWANMSSLPGFVAYAVGLVALMLVVGPGLFFVVTWASRLVAGGTVSMKKVFTALSYSLVPMGLMGWIAFSLSFLLINGSYAIPLLSDPFGWGWNLFGTADVQWTPYLSGLVPYLQVPVLLGGLVLSVFTGYRIATVQFGNHGQAVRAMVPLTGWLTVITLLFLRLYLG